MITLYKKNKLPKNFFQRDVVKVAKELLGKSFVKVDNRKLFVGVIVEVEAYNGKKDEASHSFNGKTERNKVMFDEGGYLYVYFTYGVHYCANVVTGKKGEGAAVLIRAIEPIQGIEKLFLNRYNKKDFNKKEYYNLTNGPAKICEAFEINRTDNGINLEKNNIFISDMKYKKIEICKTSRIGITKSKDLLWRFYIKNNPFVSKKND